MKTTRRILTLALVLMMVLSLAAPAMAAGTTTITFEGGNAGAEYSAYKLLNATQDGDKYAYTVNAKYEAILKAETGKATQDEIIAYISNLSDTDIRAFANDVYAAIQAASIAADYVTTTDVIADAEQGYYLIAETKLGDTHPEDDELNLDTWSLVMIDTVGDENITITTKESYPEIDKEVQEKNDSTGDDAHWGEYADYDVGDVVPFRMTSTVSGQFDDYIHYFYEVADTMSDGLTYNKDLAITIGTTDVTSLFTVVSTDHGFTATTNLKDAKWASYNITHNTKFNWHYTATLNKDAVSGAAGNTNEVVLKFQNDPYAIDEGTPAQTPPDVNIVFTFDFITNKVDENNDPMNTAGFTLYKWIAADNAWVAVGSEITGTATFEFRRLDEGIYKLVETTVPEGYNKADDIEFHVHPVYDETTDPVELTRLEIVDKDGDPVSGFDIDITPGFDDGTGELHEIETTIVNKPGKELPTTGGMGTTLFYVIGGLMFVGAAVLLVTKKRMAY